MSSKHFFALALIAAAFGLALGVSCASQGSQAALAADPRGPEAPVSWPTETLQTGGLRIEASADAGVTDSGQAPDHHHHHHSGPRHAR